MKIMCKFLRPVKSICCILLSLMVAFLIVPQTVFASEEKVVRVGYDSNSQFIKESDGHYYGYGVEYLEKIAEYTGWKYKYVKDDSWHDSLEKLRNGSIDLICTAEKNDPILSLVDELKTEYHKQLEIIAQKAQELGRKEQSLRDKEDQINKTAAETNKKA